MSARDVWRAWPGLSLLLLAVSCSERGTTLGVQVNHLASCDLSGVEARLSLPQSGRICNLVRASSGEGYQGSCEVSTDHDVVTLILEYLTRLKGSELLLARAERQVNLDRTRGVTQVDFATSDLKYQYDEDGDQVTNLDELCSGRDPLGPDGPSFAGIVEGEEGAVGMVNAQKKIFVIGERVTIKGTGFPAAAEVKVQFGPRLGDLGKISVTPLSVSSTGIRVQIPAGLDVSGPVRLEVELPERSWSTEFPVARMLAVAGKTVLNETIIGLGLSQGNYRLTELAHVTYVCLDPAAKGTACGGGKNRGWLHQVSADGRYLLALSIVDESGTQPLQVIELPTGRRWGSTMPQITARATPRFVAADSHLAIAEGDRVSFHKFDTTAQRIGGPAGVALTVPGLAAMTVGGGQREWLYLFSRAAGVEQAHRYKISLDGVGTPLAVAQGTVTLPATCGVASCMTEWSDDLAALDADKLVLARPGLNQLDFVDFGANSVDSRGLVRPDAVALAPGGLVLVASADTGSGGKGAGVCKFSGFAATSPTCAWAPGFFNLQTTVAHMAVLPEQVHALVIFSGLGWGGGDALKLLTLASMTYADNPVWATPFSLSVQP